MIYQQHKEAIVKLKILVDDIRVCLFCTDFKIDDGSTCRPMTAIKVCDEGNIWFFSEKNSDKNKSIEDDKDVQLFFSSPDKNIYMVVNGEAEIILDKVTIDELWTPIAKTWFKQGKNDPNISIIKVTPKNAYYWDNDGSQMINLMTLVPSVETVKN
jgi:general stress protein 26